MAIVSFRPIRIRSLDFPARGELGSVSLGFKWQKPARIHVHHDSSRRAVLDVAAFWEECRGVRLRCCQRLEPSTVSATAISMYYVHLLLVLEEDALESFTNDLRHMRVSTQVLLIQK